MTDWQALVRPQRPGREWLVQEFLPDIQQGEWSLIFIDGAFSHAVLKRPQVGEFRIHSKYQGQHSRESPADQLVAQAQAVLQALPTMPLCARVDGIVRGTGTFCLIELEINEPELYFQDAPEQAQMLATAIHAKRRG